MINHEIFFKGLKSNLGVRSPTISLAACFVALGALLKDAGFNLQQSAASSIFTYALPGQLIMAESLLCLLYTSPSPRDRTRSRMPSSA